MDIKINTEKFNSALHHITALISILQEIRDEFLDSILQNNDNPIQEEGDKKDVSTE